MADGDLKPAWFDTKVSTLLTGTHYGGRHVGDVPGTLEVAASEREGERLQEGKSPIDMSSGVVSPQSQCQEVLLGATPKNPHTTVPSEEQCQSGSLRPGGGVSWPPCPPGQVPRGCQGEKMDPWPFSLFFPKEAKSQGFSSKSGEGFKEN